MLIINILAEWRLVLNHHNMQYTSKNLIARTELSAGVAKEHEHINYVKTAFNAVSHQCAGVAYTDFSRSKVKGVKYLQISMN